MEEAKLDNGALGTAATGGAAGGSGAAGGGNGGTQAGTLNECTDVKGNCECLTACRGERDACLADSQCREAVNLYGRCLKSDCTDEQHPQCLESLYNRGAQELATCLRLCPDQAPCGGSAIFTKCERYCACMQQNCSKKFAAWGNVSTCLERCAELSVKDASCRGDHCEWSADDIHCEHAVNTPGLEACNRATSTPICLDRNDVGGPCTTDADCCPTRRCQGGVCG
jgi:hypothetical protein